MKKISHLTCFSLILLFTLSSLVLQAKTTTSVADGNWNASATWNNGVPGNNDNVIVSHAVILNVNVNNPGIELTINSGGSLTGGYTLTIKTNGTFSVAGDLDIATLNFKNGVSATVASGGTVTVSGNFTGSSNIANDGDIVVNGTFSNSGNVTGTGSVYAAVYSGTGSIYSESNPVNGETYYGYRWLGVNTVWENTTNWTTGIIPTSLLTAEIPSGLSNYPVVQSSAITKGINIRPGATVTVDPGYDITVNGTLNNNGTLIVNSDGTGTGSFIHTGPRNGSGTDRFNRYLPHAPSSSSDYYFHQVCTPVSGTILGDFDLINLQTYAFQYVPQAYPPGDYWENIYDVNTPIPLMKGIIISIYNDGTTGETATLDGTFVTGDQSWNIVANDTNLVGNPYPNALSWDNFYLNNTDIGTTNYIWDPSGTGNYQAYTWVSGGGTGNASCEFIQPGQSFFVVSSGATSVDFESDDRAHNHETFLKSETLNTLKIKTSGGNWSSDETYIRFMESGFTANYDIDSEAEKWFSHYEEIATEIYTVTDDNVNLAINMMPSINSQDHVVPLNFKAGVDGNYELTANGINSFDGDVFIYLEDAFNGKIHNFRTEGSYAFMASQGDAQDRFKLHFRGTALGVNEITQPADRLVIRNLDNSFEFLMESGEDIEEIRVFNVTGSLVAYEQYPATIVKLRENSSGIYFVRIKAGGELYSEKIYVK